MVIIVSFMLLERPSFNFFLMISNFWQRPKNVTWLKYRILGKRQNEFFFCCGKRAGKSHRNIWSASVYGN